MIQQEYIMLIMNCKKYLKKAKFQKLTWLKYIPPYLQYFHVIGDHELDTRYKFDNENRMLWVKVEDDYNSLPKKVIRAYEAINETFDFKYIFKTDDDQILANMKFFDIIKNVTNVRPKIHYGGFIVNIKKDHISDYYKIHPELPADLLLKKTQYCSGRFYFLSKQATYFLISRKEFIEKEHFEDYAIGFNLAPYFKQNMINILTNKFFTDIEFSDYQKLVEQGKI
jgi:hypothetical protein